MAKSQVTCLHEGIRICAVQMQGGDYGANNTTIRVFFAQKRWLLSCDAVQKAELLWLFQTLDQPSSYSIAFRNRRGSNS
jgi:hypothetical protein